MTQIDEPNLDEQIRSALRIAKHIAETGGDGLEERQVDEIKALTSLIKELVAEAKPEKRTPDYYSDSIDLYSRQCAANSRNKAIDEFEQNLLKALEKV